MSAEDVYKRLVEKKDFYNEGKLAGLNRAKEIVLENGYFILAEKIEKDCLKSIEASEKNIAHEKSVLDSVRREKAELQGFFK